MNIQIIEHEGEAAFVVLPIEEYRAMVASAEDARDLAEAVDALGDETFPDEFVAELLNADNPVAVWRKYRGLTQVELAHRSGVSQGMISAIEQGTRDMRLGTASRIAQVLGCEIDDLVRRS